MVEKGDRTDPAGQADMAPPRGKPSPTEAEIIEATNASFDARPPSKGMVRLYSALGGRPPIPATYGAIRVAIRELEREIVDRDGKQTRRGA